VRTHALYEGAVLAGMAAWVCGSELV
jgi:hypothetical protein